MKELTQWWSETKGESQPWLLLGKGPTLALREQYDLSGYRSIAINHVIRDVQADVASIIDIEVVRDCAEEIYRNAQFLLTPRYPHLNPDVNKQPPSRPIESFFEEIPILRAISEEGRLVWYNLASGQVMPGSPVIPIGMFSAEVLVNLLASLGARQIRTLGVDGGTAYAPQFSDLERTRLANGLSNFDLQFGGICRAMMKFDLDYAPLSVEHPVRVFIGTDESQMLGARVLEYSVRKHCPITTAFDTMQNVAVPMPRDPKNQPRTQFSFCRFAIPELAGYQGRAVYLDADMLVFRDFRELWQLPFNGATVHYALSSAAGRVKQFSVLLLNCQKLRWDVKEIVQGLDEGKYDYDGLMKELCIESEEAVQPGIPPQWNSLEEYVPNETGLIHYTDMPTQPWVYARNPNGDLWVACLREAVRTGYIARDEVAQGVRQGYARPSLLTQLRIPRRLWPIFNRTLARVIDARFRPHQTLQKRLAG